MDYIPPDGFNARGLERRDLSQNAFDEQKFLKELSLEKLKQGEKFKGEIIDHSLQYQTDDDQILSLVEAVSILYELEHQEWNKQNADTPWHPGLISENLEKVEQGLIAHIYQHFPYSQPTFGTGTQSEKIAAARLIFPQTEYENVAYSALKRKAPDDGFSNDGTIELKEFSQNNPSMDKPFDEI